MNRLCQLLQYLWRIYLYYCSIQWSLIQHINMACTDAAQYSKGSNNTWCKWPSNILPRHIGSGLAYELIVIRVSSSLLFLKAMCHQLENIPLTHWIGMHWGNPTLDMFCPAHSCVLRISSYLLLKEYVELIFFMLSTANVGLRVKSTMLRQDIWYSGIVEPVFHPQLERT